MLFTRSLRLEDNAVLSAAAAEHRVCPAFVFNPLQIDPARNPHYSAPAVHFMLDCLEELAGQITERGGRLVFLEGDPAERAVWLARRAGARAVYDGLDYTPFARARSSALRAACEAAGLRYVLVEDVDLVPASAERLRTYHVFTPYYERLMDEPGLLRLTVSESANPPVSFVDVRPRPRSCSPGRFRPPEATHLARGGRAAGLRLLEEAKRVLVAKTYESLRDRLVLGPGEGTTGLSAHLRFGSVSVRELAREAVRLGGLRSGVLRQLLFRSFYYRRTQERGLLEWPRQSPENKNDTSIWNAFVKGDTGEPLIDAAVRQLYLTGYMHNRARLMVAHHVARTWNQDPHKLELWFAAHLADYDAISTNAGVGEAVRALHVMKPVAQARRFDRDGAYVASWSGSDIQK